MNVVKEKLPKSDIVIEMGELNDVVGSDNTLLEHVGGRAMFSSP